jgi:hypothetical protein
LVDALEEVTQLALTSETLPESWITGVLCSVNKTGDKLDCTNYLYYICLMNVAYKVFAKVLYDRLLPYADAVVQHYQAGFQSGKSTTDQLFALRQIQHPNSSSLHRLQGSMSELSFPTKLIRLTAATLNTVLYCVKIQNDCSEYFETRQGLRQGDVLSQIIFNVVLESIVRRAIIYKTLIRPVLLCSSEVLTKREENQFLVFERKVLRMICGP